jgi:sec-independent protein translocase protein TatB
MGSLSLGEILLIVVVILVVFGPRRLPELSRKAGDLLAKLREGTSYVTQAIDSDYGEAMEPIRELKREYDNLKGDVTRAVGSIGDIDTPPKDQAPTPPPAAGTDTPPPAAGTDTGDDRPGSTER